MVYPLLNYSITTQVSTLEGSFCLMVQLLERTNTPLTLNRAPCMPDRQILSGGRDRVMRGRVDHKRVGSLAGQLSDG